MYKRWGKRLFDICTASLVLLVFCVPLIFVCVIIAVTMGFPVFFKQRRIGKDGRLFTLWKFRTMEIDPRRSNPITVEGDARITCLGRQLRRWKIDELPEFWNVLIGDMSVVGPRPDVPGYADKLEGAEREILRLHPGVTGPASLKYRNEEKLLTLVQDPKRYNDEVIYPDKVRLNLGYCRSYSFGIDLRYIGKTILTVLASDEADQTELRSH